MQHKEEVVCLLLKGFHKVVVICIVILIVIISLGIVVTNKTNAFRRIMKQKNLSL